MDLLIHPGKLNGTVLAISSKSQAHRLLICSAFSSGKTELVCPETNKDIQATVNCLCSLGARITRTARGYLIDPVIHFPNSANLYCGESGSTLRFLLPIVGALGIRTTFILEGRLPHRPLSPLWEEMERMGCSLSRPTANTICCQGKLKSGDYTIPGNVSSQFISGLLFAGALMEGITTINVQGPLESAPYADMTLDALRYFGVDAQPYRISGSFPFHSPCTLTVEGDWSNAAFFLGANFLGSSVHLSNLNNASVQGDRAITQLLANLKEYSVISLSDVPDLFPILAVVAAGNQGAEFINISRLRMKESDRIQAVAQMLASFGVSSIISQDSFTVHSAPFKSCEVDSFGDHRIAMAAAIASTIADGPVKISGAECVTKSYPRFWDDFKILGGHYEQYIR